MRLRSLIRASFSKQTFSWMLISLPHLLLLCLSSTSLHLSPPLVFSPHLSAAPLPVFLPPLPLFSPSRFHLSCARRRACALLAGRAPGIQRPVENRAAEAEACRSVASSNQPLHQRCSRFQSTYQRSVKCSSNEISIVVASRFSTFFPSHFLPHCARAIAQASCKAICVHHPPPSSFMPS